MNIHLIACILLILIFFTIGLLLVTNTPPINSLLGYRTKSAKRNQDTWDEANIFAGRCMMYLGIVLLLMTVITDFIFEDINIMFNTLGAFSGVAVIYIIYLTERRLKNVFFRDGKRKPTR